MTNLRLLYFVNNIISCDGRSGVQRVVVNLARELAKIASVDFVKWDWTANQLRYADRTDIAKLFRSLVLPDGVRVNKYAHRVNYRFSDTLSSTDEVWLLQPELGYHSQKGNDIFLRVVALCREYGISVASIFYDNIPVTNPCYADNRHLHIVYVNQLVKSDLIIPISQYAGNSLREYYHSRAGDLRGIAAGKIFPVLLPDFDGDPSRLVRGEESAQPIILSVGTVEPRKQQLETVRAFKSLRDTGLGNHKLVIVGSLHPAVADEFLKSISREPDIIYHGYLPDKAIEELYRRASLSVFASNDEGFGLPICESLSRGVPVVCANFGSMGEIAGGGGCYTVNVNDPFALREGIRVAATDPEVRCRLRSEIERRFFRTWHDYAKEITCVINAHSRSADITRERVKIREALNQVLGEQTDEGCTSLTVDVSTGPLHLLKCGWLSTGMAKDRLNETAANAIKIVVIPDIDLDTLTAWPRSELDALFQADGIVSANEGLLGELISAAEHAKFEEMLPPIVVGRASHQALLDEAEKAITDFMCRRKVHTSVAEVELLVSSLGRVTAQEYSVQSGPILSIVISTYNRWAFLRENVRWLLKIVGPYRSDVEILVVDNASTDNSWEGLIREFSGDPVRIIRNCFNVGMLGNLRCCSAAVSTRFTWMVGDDDFVVPETIPAILNVLRNNPELPFLFMNFGVYYRDLFGDNDTPQGVISERVELAPCPTPSGMTFVRDAAVEHDNLFTAIYPIVFRTDLAAACFNYTFSNAPFSDLIESVPTTKMILGTYSDAPCYWYSSIGIVGNAVNSWRQWRVRWHGAIMPEVLVLADEGGVDPRILHKWSMTQWELFLEARNLYPDASFGDAVGATALDRSTRVFRRELPVDSRQMRRPGSKEKFNG